MKLEFERYTKLRNQISRKKGLRKGQVSRDTQERKRGTVVRYTVHTAARLQHLGLEGRRVPRRSRRQPPCHSHCPLLLPPRKAGALKAGLKIRAGWAVVASRIAFDQIYF